MPSFFEGLKKVFQGKPVFDAPQQGAAQPNAPAQEGDDAPRPDSTPTAQPMPARPKVLPRVFVERTKTYMNGSRMDCYADIRNDSNQEILLDKVTVMTAVRQLDHTLRPHERRQFLIYSGSRPNNDNKDECDIQYKSLDGDYFCTLHDVILEKQADETYLIMHINYRGFRDI